MPKITPVLVADLLAEDERLPVYEPEMVWLAHWHEPWRPAEATD